MPAERYYGQLTFHAPEGDLPPQLRDTSMTNAPETEALVPDEPSTSLATSREHSVGIPMDPSITAVAKGQVEGAWSITALGDDWVPEKVFVLPEGETMQVAKGTAIRVQSSNGWHHCEFPQSGVLHGPVVWAMAEAASEQALMSNLDERTSTIFIGSITWVSATLATFAGAAFVVIPFLKPPGGFDEPTTAAILVAAMLLSMGVAYGIATGISTLTDRLMDWWFPRTITSLNQRVSKTLRMPRSVFLALGAPQPHLKLVSPELPMDDLDREIHVRLETYRAQRAQLSARKVASGPMVEHASAMIDEIETRLKVGTGALREDSLRQSYLALIQRAEADILKLLHKQEAEEAEGVVRDISALIRQMDRHQG